MNTSGVLFESIKQRLANPLILQVMCAVLVVLIVWEVVSGVRLMSNLQQSVRTQVAPSQNFNESGMFLKLQYPLFGEYVPSNLDAAGVRQSMLNLKVVGIIFATDEKNSQVILQNANGQEHFFGLGDTLPGGGVIKRITMDGVLVLREGELERLSLQKEDLIFEAPAKPMRIQ